MNINNFFKQVPPVTLHITIINVLVWLATAALATTGVSLNDYLGLHYWQCSQFGVWQLVTSMFMHDGLAHIFFNMFSLVMLGAWVERAMGSRRYLLFYFVCGVGAGLVQELMWHFTWRGITMPMTATYAGGVVQQIEVTGAELLAHSPGSLDEFFKGLVAIGASGAVFGVLLAFGVLFPNMPMYIIPLPFPIKAKWMVLGYGALELMFGVSGTMDHVAHFAHLGGMIFAAALLFFWYKTGVLRRVSYGVG